MYVSYGTCPENTIENGSFPENTIENDILWYFSRKWVWNYFPLISFVGLSSFKDMKEFFLKMWMFKTFIYIYI